MKVTRRRVIAITLLGLITFLIGRWSYLYKKILDKRFEFNVYLIDSSDHAESTLTLQLKGERLTFLFDEVALNNVRSLVPDNYKASNYDNLDNSYDYTKRLYSDLEGNSALLSGFYIGDLELELLSQAI